MATYTYGTGDMAAIKSALAAGGHTIYLRPGKYVIQNSGGRGWTVATGTKLIGQGSTENQKLSGTVGAVLVMGSTRSYPDNSGMIYMNNADNVLFENLSFTGYNVDKCSTGNTFGDSPNVIMYGDYCDNLEVRKCFFAYSEIDFIKLRRANNVKVHHNRMWFPGHECLYILGGCNTVDFSYNDCRTRTNSACRISYTNSNVKIHHNNISGKSPSSYTFYDGDVGGTFTKATALDGGSAHPGLELDATGSNYEIYQNNITDINGCGIWIFSKTTKQSNLKIHHNTFINCGLGGCNYCNATIHIYQADDVLIYNNRITGASGYGRALHCYRGYRVKKDSEGKSYNVYFGDPIADTYNISFTNNTGALARDIEIVNTLASSSSKHTITSSGNSVGSGNGVTEATGWTAGTTPVTQPPTLPPDTTTPVVSITTSKTALVQPSGGTLNSANITWSVRGCTIASITTTRWSGTDWLISDFRQIALSGGAASGVYATSPTATSRYTINGAYETVIPSRHASSSCEIGVTTEVVPAPTCVSFYASKSNIPNTERISLIAIGLNNVTSASVDVETNTGVITNYPMSLNATTGTASNVGFINTGTRACTLKLVGPGGTNSVQYKIYVTVTPPPALVTPSLTFTSSYTEIVEDDEIELTWSTTNATNFYIKVNSVGTLDIGGNVLSGSKRVSLNETTTFEAHAVNTSTAETKETVKSITVTVYPRVAHVPIIRLQTDTQTIDIDQTARIYWTAENTTTLVCNHGVGNLNNVSGYIDVSPVATTTYTFTADGPDGAANVDITITVIQSDIISLFVVSPTTINSGESATLAWMSRYGKDAYIDNSIGLVTETARGTHIVSPTSDTTYTLTISGSMGVLNKTCDVTVVEAIPSGSISAAFSIDNPLINVGETATISWIASNTDVMACGQDIGFVSVPSGSLPVAPIVYTDYEFVLVKDTDSFEYNIPIYVVDDYVLLNPTNPTYEQTYIDMTGKRIYVSGGQSTSDTSYTWDIDTNASMRPNPDNEMITFAYDETGYYMITLTSINRDGEVLKQTVRANVINE